jgi:hypothetical protein
MQVVGAAVCALAAGLAAGQGLEAVTSTPQGFTDIIKSDHAKYVKLIKDAGIKIE